MKLLILAVSLLSICYGQTSTFKLDTSMYKSRMKFWDSIPLTRNSVVATIDTNNQMTIPRGWQWVVIMKDGELWFVDSTKTVRKRR